MLRLKAGKGIFTFHIRDVQRDQYLYLNKSTNRHNNSVFVAALEAGKM